MIYKINKILNAVFIVGIICVSPASALSTPCDKPEPGSQVNAGNKISNVHYTLEKIHILGNKKTLNRVITRHIEIKPGMPFAADDPRLIRSLYHLRSLGLFKKVDFSLKKGSRRGNAILVVNVEEKNTIVIKDLVFGFSEIPQNPSPYGGFGITQRSFLGTGTQLSAAFAFGADQFGYQMLMEDNHFLNSNFGLHFQGKFINAKEYFGQDMSYTTMDYKRAQGKIGGIYNLSDKTFFLLNYRYEIINAKIPLAAYHTSYSETTPIDFQLLPGHSFASTITAGLVRDTRDNVVLPLNGSKTSFEVELSTEIFGSDYEFSKFTVAQDFYFPLPKDQCLKLALFTGLIMGDAPFFDKFFTGDFSAFIPSRILGMNFGHLHPGLLETRIKEMRYENMAASILFEYSLPFYRGSGFFYGINGFASFGVFAMASRQDLRIDPKGYEGFKVVPMDITADIGVKFDTSVGLFVITLASIFRMFPPGDETTK